MTDAGKGWLFFIAAMGMMLSLISIDIADIETWNEIFQPGFISRMFAHIGAVIAAFIGGKLIPSKE